MGQALVKDLLLPELKMVDLKDKLDDVDVLCIFDQDPSPVYRTRSSWLKKGENRYLVFIQTQEDVFLKSKGFPLHQDPKVRLFYYTPGHEEIFQQIAWEFVFLRFGFGSCTDAGKEFFARLEHYHRGVDLLASDYQDMGVKVLSNVFKNLSLLPKSSLGHVIEGKCAGMTAIVCGAGPSLNSAAPFLAEWKNSAILIAGGTANLALNALGVEPHFSAYFDPEPLLERFLNQQNFETPIFYQGRVSHDLLSKVHGQLLWIPDGGSYPLESHIAAQCGIFAERFDAGWTVSNFCTGLAKHLGCTTIIFVGMDFSCGEQVYAAQISEEKNPDTFIELEKGKRYSKKDWLVSAEWTVEFAHKNPQIQWINASEGGLPLPGIPDQKLSSVVLPESKDFEGFVHSLVASAPHSQVTLEKVTVVKTSIKESFEKTLLLCDALLKIWEKHFPASPLELGEYVLIEHDLEQEICMMHFLNPLWNVWKYPILRNSSHALGNHLHRLLFFKQTLELHLLHLRS